MASACLIVDLRDMKGLARLFDDASLDAAARAGLLSGAAEILESGSRARFDTKEDPEGKPWAALAGRTRRRYEKAGQTHRSLLLGTGRLRDSLRSEVAADSRSAFVGATMIYAAVHQFGWPEKNIPARPYLGASAEDAKAITDAAVRFLAGRFG